MRTLNLALDTAQRLDEATLGRVFETYWPQFESEFKTLLARTESVTPVPEREQSDILSEILETTRSLSTRISNLELSNSGKISTERSLQNEGVLSTLGRAYRKAIPNKVDWNAISELLNDSSLARAAEAISKNSALSQARELAAKRGTLGFSSPGQDKD